MLEVAGGVANARPLTDNRQAKAIVDPPRCPHVLIIKSPACVLLPFSAESHTGGDPVLDFLQGLVPDVGGGQKVGLGEADKLSGL